jgi:hypothetical protein
MRASSQGMMMKFVLTLVIASLFSSAPLALAEPAQVLNAHDVTTWPRADVQRFGCFLETAFNHKDKKFNCALKHYRNHGDPCKNTKAYYEGPQFPPDKVALVDGRFKSLELSWEHGKLQAVVVTLTGKFSETDLRAAFPLPEEASIQDCSLTQTCIVLIGFDHMGAGDVDCGEE